MSLLLANVGYACRVLRRQPVFSSVAILTMALGIGATTAVFSVVYGLLLRPLPYRDPGRLVILLYGHQGRVSPWFSPLNFRDYVTQSEAFTGAAALAPSTVNITGLGDPERLEGARVSWNYFDILGVAMAHGRSFVEADNQGDGNRIVLSDRLWRRRFGGRPEIINSTLTLDGHVVTVVGIASADVTFPPNAEFWQPLVFTPRDTSAEARGAQWVQVLARLKDTLSPQMATTALQGVAGRLARDFPRTEMDATPRCILLQERIVRNVHATLLTLVGAVVLVLLIACANVANLLLARALARGREVAIRLALGATRRQLITQVLTESLVLGLFGAVAGVGVAVLLVRALVLLGPTSIPRLSELAVDANALAFALSAAIVTSLVCGATPAVSLSRRVADGCVALRSHGAIGGSTTNTRRLLVISELAVAAMLWSARACSSAATCSCSVLSLDSIRKVSRPSVCRCPFRSTRTPISSQRSFRRFCRGWRRHPACKRRRWRWVFLSAAISMRSPGFAAKSRPSPIRRRCHRRPCGSSVATISER